MYPGPPFIHPPTKIDLNCYLIFLFRKLVCISCSPVQDQGSLHTYTKKTFEFVFPPIPIDQRQDKHNFSTCIAGQNIVFASAHVWDNGFQKVSFVRSCIQSYQCAYLFPMKNCALSESLGNAALYVLVMELQRTEPQKVHFHCPTGPPLSHSRTSPLRCMPSKLFYCQTIVPTYCQAVTRITVSCDCTLFQR